MAVSFDEERSYAPVGAPQQSSGLLGLMQKWGIAKNAKEANTALIVIIVVLVVIAAAVFVFARPSESESVPVDVSKLRAR